jgi:CubicO group peptidase (beta-lactamase class C family)
MTRTETWLALILSALGLIPAAILGLWAYMSGTAVPLHPDPGSVPSAIASRPGPAWEPAVRQAQAAVRSALITENLPGLSVAVGVGDDVVWAEGFGWADLDKRVAVAPGTTFRIGTASIPITSAAVGLLIDEGRLKADEEIQIHVPTFPKKPWPVTLAQLMGHTAGLRNDGGDESPLYAKHCDRPVEGLATFADRDLLAEPGTRYHYSRYGFIAVSAAVEAAAAEPFLLFVQKRLFEPLGMDHTRAESTTETTPSQATSYFPRFAADPRYGLHLMRELDYSCYSGSSGFVSTPSDLVRFGLAVRNGRLLQPSTVAALQAPRRLTSGEETGYGLGWDLETAEIGGKPARMVGHDGDALGGNVSSLWTFPDSGIVVAVTSNISYADTPALAVKIAQAFALATTWTDPGGTVR